MWQQSKFYTKAYFGSHAWHLRWLTVTSDKITSVPDRMDPEKHMLTYPKFNKIEVDEARLIIRIENPVEGKRDCKLFFVCWLSRHLISIVPPRCACIHSHTYCHFE